LARCSDVASDSRHDHASGTLIVRPSVRTAVIASSETLMDFITGSGAAAVLVPSKQRYSASRWMTIIRIVLIIRLE